MTMGAEIRAIAALLCLAAPATAQNGGGTDVARSLAQRGIARLGEGRPAEAARLLEEAIRILEPEMDAHVAELANLWQALGVSCFRDQLYAKAENAFQRALRLRHEIATADPLPELELLSDLGAVCSAEHRWGEAEQILQRARRQLALLPNAGLTLKASVLTNLANVFAAQGRLAELEVLYREALAAAEASQDTSGTFDVPPLHNLAVISANRGEYAAALPLFARAEERIRVGTALPLRDVLQILVDYRTCLRRAGRKREASQVQMQLRRIAAGVPIPQSELVVDVHQLRPH